MGYQGYNDKGERKMNKFDELTQALQNKINSDRKGYTEAANKLAKSNEEKRKIFLSRQEPWKVIEEAPKVYQYDRDTKELIKVWKNRYEVIDSNPDYIMRGFANCLLPNHKTHTYRGYFWKEDKKG